MRVVSAFNPQCDNLPNVRTMSFGLPDSPNDEQSVYDSGRIDFGSDRPLPAPALPSTTKQIRCNCGVWVPANFSGLFVVSPRTGETLNLPDHAVDQLPPRVRARIVRVGKFGVGMFTPHELHEIHRLSETPTPAIQLTTTRSSRRQFGFGSRWSR